MLNREKLYDIFYELIENLELDPTIVAEVYGLDYRSQDRAFVINVKGRGLPDQTTIQILKEKYGEELVEQAIDSEEFEMNIWNIVDQEVENLSNELGVPIYSYGRSGGYLGINEKDVNLDLHAYGVITDFNGLVNKYVELFQQSFSDVPEEDQKELEEDEDLLIEENISFLEQNVEFIYESINVPILKKFKEVVEAKIEELSSKRWAEIIAPFFEDRK
jgi:hypothetical protein